MLRVNRDQPEFVEHLEQHDHHFRRLHDLHREQSHRRGSRDAWRQARHLWVVHSAARVRFLTFFRAQF